MTSNKPLVSLAELKDVLFSVPIYQRPYVWGQAQVQLLLEDLWEAYASAQDLFYLGGTLVMRPKDSSRLELIDGQQRFTTLWMISLINTASSASQGNCLSAWSNGGGPKQPRIAFAIRPQVEDFFAAYLKGEQAPLADEYRAIGEALQTIQQFFVKHQSPVDSAFSLDGFREFIHCKVRLVLTEVDAETDLNKLFELINNRGVQLQHHEILKARLLHLLLGESNSDAYASLWDACAEMDDYVERNLRAITGKPVAPLFKSRSASSDATSLGCASSVLLALKGDDAASAVSAKGRNLADILAGPTSETGDSNAALSRAAVEEEEEGKVRSVISFSMLLQHTLRIWLSRRERADLPRILDKELLSHFEKNFFKPSEHDAAKAMQVRSFIELLWEVRFCFDQHVIKWVTQDDTAIHLIGRLSANPSVESKSGLQRTYKTDSTDGFELLQSMLYHSQQITTHYWLTPLLAYMHANRTATPEVLFTYLRQLDNQLFCSSDKDSLLKRSHSFLLDPGKETQHDSAILEQAEGVKFPSYWFYKLEFVLWYQRKLVGQSGNKLWEKFRLKAKNSVEHVSAQTPQKNQDPDDLPVSAEYIDNFGNLALVSRSVNSAFGNNPFKVKKIKFNLDNQLVLDSLKLDLIYQHEKWGDTPAQAHQRAMIDLLRGYLLETPSRMTL
jgi:hypothetical protein